MPIPTARKQYTYLASRTARLKLGLTLAQEMSDIIDHLGPEHPDLNSHILLYIQNLDTRHPEWSGFWDRGTSCTSELKG